MRTSHLFAGALLLFVLIGCNDDVDIILNNVSDSAIESVESVELVLEGKTVPVGDIFPGESARVELIPPVETDVLVVTSVDSFYLNVYLLPSSIGRIEADIHADSLIRKDQRKIF